MTESSHIPSDIEELEYLLNLAGSAADWGHQMSSHFRDAPGGQYFWPKFSAYHVARTKYFATRRPLNHYDYSGCAGCMGPVGDDGKHVWNIRDDCSYHLAAKLQPWNHRIPWACGNYYDGCNCEGGPFYDPPEGTFS